MKAVAFALGILLCNAAMSADQSECLKLADKDKRLECYDKALGYDPKIHEAIPAPAQPQPKPLVQFFVKDEGKLDSMAGITLGSKAATLSPERIDGVNHVSSKFGVIAAFRPFNDAGWQPFLGFSWTRDPAAKTPKDVRDLGVGIVLTPWDAYSSGWTILATPRLIRRTDIYGHSHSNLFHLHGNVVVLDWVSDPDDGKSNTYSFIPQFGVQLEDRSNSKADEGRWHGGYLGLQLNAQLNALMPRLGASIRYQRFRDARAPEGNSKRSEGYTTGQVTYDFTDPNDKTIRVRPSLVLSREVGADPVAGVGATNKTKLSIGLKIE